ncbi:MAG: DUF4976 domain-containing protein, partial [Planctomycetaceae bacterium]|nr:DUF4976 domain-containing protein [Planctomycetaceae bacterium]
HGWFDKRFMYEESYRMPFLVRWPGVIKPGSRSKELTSNLDFGETFLDIASVDIPSDMQGVSLKPLFDGSASRNWRQSLYYHYYEFYEDRRSAHMVRRHCGVRTPQHKLIHFYNLDEWELYDLKNDPREMISRYDDPAYAGVVEELKAELARLQNVYEVPDDTGSVSKSPPSLKARPVQKKLPRNANRKKPSNRKAAQK